MNETPFRKDSISVLHRGAIYSFRLVSWLESPLWILREHHWQPPRYANIYTRKERSDAFKLSPHHEEDVIARAKVRSVIIIASDKEIQSRAIKKIRVAPLYSLKLHKSPEFIRRLRENAYPDLYYIPSDPTYPLIEEGYIDFKGIHLIHKEFLNEGKLEISLSLDTIKAILYRYKEFLLRL